MKKIRHKRLIQYRSCRDKHQHIIRVFSRELGGFFICFQMEKIRLAISKYLKYVLIPVS